MGASRASAMWLVVHDAAMMIAGGMLIALPAVWGLRRFVEAELFGVPALHVPTMVIAGFVLAIVALSAAMLPAWRAATVNPIEALRV